MMPNTSDIETLRTQIAKHTGRKPESTNERYLKQRLADLTAAKHDDVRVPVSISLTSGEHDALVALANKEQCSASEVVRRALREYAAKHGTQRIIKQLTNKEGQ